MIENDDACFSFDLTVDGETYNVNLGVPGRHHVYNAAAAIAAAVYCGCTVSKACETVGQYTGAKRRFELTGEASNGALVYHDYAHHPREVKATIAAAKGRTKGKLITVLQPHTYSRTKELLDEFSSSFKGSDVVIVTDIYAAREKDPGDIHSRDLVEKAKTQLLDTECIYADSFETAANMALVNSTKDDLIITLGAGDIEKVNRILCK